jgi:hypothetical protein
VCSHNLATTGFESAKPTSHNSLLFARSTIMVSFTVNLFWEKKGIHMQVEVEATTSWGEVKAVFKDRYASETKDVDPDFHGNPDSATMQDLGVNAKKSTIHLNVPLAFVQ